MQRAPRRSPPFAGIRYGRYADDRAFSGSPSRAGTKRLIELAGTIDAEEGFALNQAKTSVMTQGRGADALRSAGSSSAF
jgi:hypothetical protein